jgi:hypothetical protein
MASAPLGILLLILIGTGSASGTPPVVIAWPSSPSNCDLLFSEDGGRRWSASLVPATATTGLTLSAIDFAQGQFFVAGSNRHSGVILASRNGFSWVTLFETPHRIDSICIRPTSSKLPSLLLAFSEERLLSSEGGAPLHSSPQGLFPRGSSVRSIACGSSESGPRFVLIGSSDAPDSGGVGFWRASTETGGSLTSFERTPLKALSLTYGAGRFICSFTGGFIESSHDGQNWTPPTQLTQGDITHLVWSGTRFLASSNRHAWMSPDGLVWSDQPIPVPAPVSFSWEAESEAGYVAFGPDGSWFSPDLVSWSRNPLPSPIVPLKVTGGVLEEAVPTNPR